jgi:hypothetical protein
VIADAALRTFQVFEALTCAADRDDSVLDSPDYVKSMAAMESTFGPDILDHCAAELDRVDAAYLDRLVADPVLAREVLGRVLVRQAGAVAA